MSALDDLVERVRVWKERGDVPQQPGELYPAIYRAVVYEVDHFHPASPHIRAIPDEIEVFGVRFRRAPYGQPL